MSSRMELKAASIKRSQKKRARMALKTSVKKANDDDGFTLECFDKMLPYPKARVTTGILPKKKKIDKLKTAPRVEKGNILAAVRKTAEELETDFTDAPPFVRQFWNGKPGEDPPGQPLKEARKEIGVLVKGNTLICPGPISSINSELLPDAFEKVCSVLSISNPTPVQKQSWPAILNGANVLGIAPTGSGKTLAYSLPLIPHILDQIHQRRQIHAKHKLPPPRKNIISPKALILVPTRELAVQVASVLKNIKRACGITSGVVYGGVDKHDQLQTLRASCNMDDGYPRLDVLIGTPGRLEDYLYTASASNNLQLEVKGVTYLVMDEADRMLAMGFREQLNAICRCIRPDRQTVLFSATFPGRLREATTQWLHDPVTIRCSAMELTDHGKIDKADIDLKTNPTTVLNGGIEDGDASVDGDADADADADGDDGKRPAKRVKIVSEDIAAADQSLLKGTSSLTISTTIHQKIHVCASHKKPRLLLKFITQSREQEKQENVRQVGPMIIFCNKIKTLKFVHDFLKRQDVRVDALHGQLAQHIREAVLLNFKSGKSNILIATDVAARGLHINRLKYVVNYDFPLSLEQYCHRVGRTGRQGQSGIAYSLLTRNLSMLAKDLITLLTSCQQEVEQNLQELAEQHELGVVMGDNEESENAEDEDSNNET